MVHRDFQDTSLQARRAEQEKGNIPKRKISPPRLNPHIFFRRNLLNDLADLLREGSVWITGPPGAGKTILALCHLHSLRIPAYWYQLDVIDSDPASFFSLFPHAFGRQEVEEPSLPEFVSETMLHLRLFSRKFFRELFRVYPGPALIVLDNYQDLEDDSPVHTIISLMLEELPPACRLLVLSRSQPPQPFARSRVNNLLHVLDGKRLPFTREEIGEMIRFQGIDAGRGNLDEYLYDVSLGWAAGLTLMLEQLDAEDGHILESHHHEVVFDYFADVVFQREEKEQQEMLLKSSILPELHVEVVEALCERSGAGPYLRELSQKNYFTYRVSKEQNIYQFHPLFREFLLRSAEEILTVAELRTLRRRGAELLRESGQIIEGIELLFEAGDWPACVSLLKENADSIFHGARFGTIFRWLSGMPAEIVESDPRLQCYKGIAAMPFFPQVSIDCLQKSFEVFKRNGDFDGALFCCPALIRANLSFMTDMGAMDPLIEFIERRIDVQDLGRRNDPRDDQLVLGMFRALVSRRPDHPEIELWAELVEKLLKDGRLIPGPVLPLHYLWTGRFAEAESAINRSLAMKEHLDSSPLDLTGILSLKLQYHLVTGETEECRQTVEKGLEIVEETGIKIWKTHYFLLGAACCLNRGEKAGAEEFIAEVEENLEKIRGLDLSYYHLVKAFYFLLTGEKKHAEYHGARALEVGISLGMPSYENWCRLGTGLLAADRQDHEAAVEHFDRIFDLCSRSNNPWFTCQAHLGMALVHLGRDQRREAVQRIQKGFSLARQHGYGAFFFFTGKMMTELCILAQEEAVETDFVRSYIRHWKLIPKRPCVRPGSWPWPVRIFALGEFRVELYEDRLAFSPGRQTKPLELLKVLISASGGRVGETRVQDILWPDSEGDKQSRSLKTTLHRLRRLLRVKEAVIHKNKTLCVNPACCWVDALAFREAADKVITADQGDDPEQRVASARNVLDLYHGPFLSERIDEEWTFAARSDLAHRFRSLVERAGTFLEEKKDWASADRLYREAISKDPSCEIHYQRRMVCLRNMGYENEALRVYRECRERLKSLLGEKPSLHMTRLRDEILSS
jgi:LuxR family transcriptional regulator, maltose regulon positive regulatory protein